MGMQPFLGSALTQPDQRFTKFDFEDMAEDPSVLISPAAGLRCCNIICQRVGARSGQHLPVQDAANPIRRQHHRLHRPGLVIASGETTTISNQLYVDPRTSLCWPTWQLTLIWWWITAGFGGLPSLFLVADDDPKRRD